MQLKNRTIGICSWSLQTSAIDVLIEALSAVGVSHLQLDIGPYLDHADAAKAARQLTDAGVTLTAGMIGFVDEDYSTIARIHETGGLLPDGLADQRINRIVAAARVAKSEFGIGRVSTHVGFLPDADSAQYPVLQQRIGLVADAFADLEMELLFETGQETARQLSQFLDDLARPNVKVNFDPANMLLYGSGDPIAALQRLGPRIGHVHIKDAVVSSAPGKVWGEEVAAGDGQVNWPVFLNTLDAIGYAGPLVIERESGSDRIGDIRQAIGLLKTLLK